MTPPAKKPRKTKAKKRPEPKELTLDYHLDELPSSQHRAGLAGLWLMHRWRAKQPEQRGLCEVELTGDRSLRIRLDRDGLAQLLDLTYAAANVERAYPKPFKNKAPLREEVRTETSARTGKSKEKTVYFYPVTVPHGAYLTDWDTTGGDASEGGKWLKLWRDMVWNILRGVPATRAPFQARAENKPDKLTGQMYSDLAKSGRVVDLPSTYYLGAQAKTAENVKFQDLARFQLLLHFWPYVAPIYVPQTVDADNKRQFRGYAIVVPDVADLEAFCDALEHTMKQRTGELAGYIPRQAVIDLPAAAGLDLMSRLTERVQGKRDFARTAICGVDVFHVAKEGNNVRVLGTRRVDVERRMIDSYKNVRDRYRDHRFQRQRLLNLLDGQRWHHGFDRILTTTSTRWTIESSWFRRDIREAFTNEESMSDEQDRENNLESLIYKIVGIYVSGRLSSKHSLEWEKVKDLPEDSTKRKEYRAKRLAVGKDAFLSIRSRSGQDFVDYFSGTLFSIPQKALNEESFITISRALLQETSKVRTLTLLALSARS